MKQTCIRLAAAAALLLTLLTGCGTGSGTDEASLPEIVIGSDTYPPFIYLDNNGVPTGIDVDIATEAFRRMGYRAVIQNIDWEQKTELVESGEIDCIWGCFSIQGRENQYRWAGPYMVSRQVIAVSEDSPIQSFSDLAGKTIAVQSTTKPEEVLLTHSDNRIPETVNVLSVEDRSVQYAALDCGYVDAIAAHETAILQYMKDYDTSFRILDDPILTTGIGVAFALNDDRGLDGQLSETLREMRSDGTMAQIVGKYLDNAESYLEVESLEN